MSKTSTAKKAKAPVTTTKKVEPNDEELPLGTDSDLVVANALLPSNRMHPITKVSSHFPIQYTAPAMTKALDGVKNELASFAGCGDVDGMLALAEEGAILQGVFLRLQASASRAGQRVIEINMELQAFDTSLSRAVTTAAPGSKVQKALSSWSKQRKSGFTPKKAKATKTKNARKKGAASKS